MLISSKPKVSVRVLSAAIALSAGTEVLAQGLALEEVVVTAQKREESIQNTPISLAAFDTSELENKGISGLTDLRSAVPSLQMTPHPNSGATARIFMRGIGNNDDQVTQDPSVAVYLDGVYVARSQGLAMDVADIERVEVLRGPQGSLYGRNATGGAINFITKAPELGRFGFQQSLTAGSDNLLRSRTQFNVPLGEQAAAQFSYLNVEKDGFVKNEGTGVSRFGDQDREAFRVALLWEVSDVLDVAYSYDHSILEDTPVFLAAVPFHPQQGKRPSHGSPFVRDLRANDIVAKGHALTLTWELTDSLSFKSITGYRELSNETNQNYHAGVDPRTRGAPLFITDFDSDQDQFSQEFQLVGDALDSRLEYVAGVYYFDESGDSYDTTDTAAPGFSERWVTIDNTAYAVFGQGTYTPPILDDKLHVTVGLRWSKDERKATLQNGSVSGTGVRTLSVPAGDGDNDFSNVSPSLIVAYDVTDSVNVYGKVVTGYKTGGFNTRASSIERFNAGFDEENLISYELGLKSQWWEDRVRLNAAVFRADYDDIQINVQSDPGNVSVTDVLNAGEAVINGFELETSARLTEGLTVSARYAYLDADYEKIIDAAGNDLASSFQFVEAPPHSYTAEVQYEFPATPIGVVTAMMDYTWQDKKFSSSSDGRYITDDYGLLNARLNLSDVPVGVGALRLGLWGRNLEDKEYYVGHFNAGVPTAIFGEPRSYGIDVVYEY